MHPIMNLEDNTITSLQRTKPSTDQYLPHYRYTPLTPVRVQAGDILGMHQPYTFSSNLQVFMQEDGPVNYYRETVDPLNNMTSSDPSEMRLPLINIQFVASKKNQTTGVIIAVVLVVLTLTIVGGVALTLYKARVGRIRAILGSNRRNQERSVHPYDTTVQVGRRSITTESERKSMRTEAEAPKAAGMCYSIIKTHLH